MKLLCTLFACISFTASAQTSQKDSLAQLIKILPEDTSKIIVYYEYGYIYEDINLDSAAYFFLKGKAIADKYSHVKLQIKFASYYSDVLNLRGDLEGSYRVNKEALDLALKHKLPVETGKCYANVGNVFNHQGRYDSAAHYYMLAADTFDKAKEYRFLNILYQNLAVVFDYLKQYEKAIEWSDKSIALSKQRADSFTLVSVMINKSGTLSSMKRYNEAITTLTESVEICKKIGNSYQEELAYIALGNAYSQLKQYDKALSYFQKALVIIKEQGFTTDESTALAGLAMTHFFMKKYKEADGYIMQALKITESTKEFADLSNQYKLAADIKAHIGDYQKAFHYLQQYSKLNDSLTNASVTSQVHELERKYETVRKDKAIADQQLLIATNINELRTKQTLLFVSVGAGLVLAIIFFVSFRSYRNKRRLQEQRILSLQKEAEVIRLKATLEGQQEERQRIAKEIHDDIGSGLTSIVFLSNTANGDGEKISKIGSTARGLVTQMNEIVWSMSTDQDKLEDLVAYIRHNISEMLNVVGIDYIFNIPDEIPDVVITGVQRRNIYLAVKEAVHNCIKHAEATLVTITMNFSNGLTIRIADNGKGIQQEVVRKFGNGMKNMKHRMEQTGGSFQIIQQKPLALEMKLPEEKII